MSSDSGQERTEQPTQRKLDRSREKGQVAYSADLTNGVSLLATTLLFALMSDHFMDSFAAELVKLLSNFGASSRNDPMWMNLLSDSTWNAAIICLPIVLVSFTSSLAVGGVLTGFRPSPGAINLDLEKLNPVKGMAKLFSVRSLVRGVMSVFKLSIISAIVYFILKHQTNRVSWAMATSMEQSVEMIVDLVILMLLGVSSGLVVLGIGDFVFQKWKHLEDMKMSRQELVDERKEDEGDPQIRARIKRVQREISQRRMMQDVSSATVVITNPTHFAVALKYEGQGMTAPVVVAKGQDHLALKIIALAKAHNVAVVERKPLARSLYHNVPVGSEIPLELYQTVAEVLSYIHSIDRQIR